MTITRKDLTATLLTALAVLTFAATHQGWNVWLVGDSRRWATGVIVVLGALACGQGSRIERTKEMFFFSALGVVALALAVATLWTASLTLLSLLVLDMVVLWAASTFRHALHVPQPPLVN
jgi:hypothetical protein